MITSSRSAIAVSFVSVVAALFAGCGDTDVIDDTDVTDVTDDTDVAAIAVDFDVAVAGVIVSFVTDNDPVGCVEAGRCSVRFGDVAADIAWDYGVVAAVVPAGAVSGAACLTLDGVERCADVEIVDAPRIEDVTVHTEACPCRCIADEITVLQLQGIAFPADAVVTFDGVARGGWPTDSEHLELRIAEVVEPGTHTVVVTAPSHDNAESNSVTIVVD